MGAARGQLGLYTTGLISPVDTVSAMCYKNTMHGVTDTL